MATSILVLVMNEIAKTVALLRPYRWKIFKISISAILLSFFGLAGPWITKILIDNVLPNKDYSLLIFVLIISLSLGVFQTMMGLMRHLFSTLIGLKVSLDARSVFCQHLLSLPVSFFDSRQTGEVLSRFNDVDQSLTGMLALLNNGLMNILSLLIFPPILLLIDWKLALIAIAVIPFDAFIYYCVNKQVRKYARLIAEKRAELSARSYEAISGVRTIKSTALESIIHSKIEKLMGEVQRLSARLALIQQGSGIIVGIIRSCGTFLYMLYGWHQILGGSLTLGTFMAFSNYIGYLYNPVLQLTDMSQDIQQILVHSGRFFEIFDLKTETVKDRKARPLPKINGAIVLEDVTFGYNGSSHILRSLNIKIPAGCTAAIVGRSGIGKTTIANLIVRFYDPSEGSVFIDGFDIKHIQLKSLRAQIGYILQEPFLFHGTVRENLVMTDGATSGIELERACKLVNAHDFIANLPKGYETQIGERGVKLSQGQKQRICLARALIHNPPILILDEATCALDSDSEAVVQSTLKSLRQDKTTIIIAHRLATLKGVDAVHVLENGLIAESGTHESLIKNGRIYNELYSHELLAS